MKLAARRITTLIFLFLIVVTLTGFGCRRPGGALDRVDQSLVVWGLWQDSDMIQPAIDAFRAHTGARVEYRKIASVADYERTLLSALAEGKGPDVFVIHHTWVESKTGIMSPAPTDIVDARDVQEEFVDAVSRDLVRDGLVYALPTSVDTLAMYYNRDLFNAAGIARPPATWQDVHTVVERLTQVSRIGAIEQSGVALGTAANINRAGDIVQLLMIQGGVPIFDPERNTIEISNDTGEQSLAFYTDFANRTKTTYSWNLEQDYSLDAFAEGETAMMFNYSYHIPTIRAKNPRLNLAIAPMPQISDTQPVNFAAYWPFAVSHTSQAPQLAWQFVRVLTGEAVAAQVNEKQLVPPARREDVTAASRDPLLGTYATQALTATTWPRNDITATDAVFHDMIDSVVTGRATVAEALRQAEDKLRQLIPREGSGI